MKPVRGSWLERRFVPMVRKYAVRNPCCFPPGPGEISAVLGKLEALNHAGGEPRASVGTIVRMEDLLSGEQGCFQLVWPDEAAPEQDRLSILSPLGAALLGARRGDEVMVTLFGCRCDFRVLALWEAEPREGSAVPL
jgi:GreA/GreB family transcription elongation factor